MGQQFKLMLPIFWFTILFKIENVSFEIFHVFWMAFGYKSVHLFVLIWSITFIASAKQEATLIEDKTKLIILIFI